MMKVFYCVAVFLFANCSFASTVNVIAPSSNQKIGGNFSVTIEASDMIDLYAFQFDLQYDPKLISAAGLKEGAFFNNANHIFVPGIIDNLNGSILGAANTLVSAIAGINGSGSFATINFKALDLGVSVLSITNLILLDSGLNVIGDVTINNSSVIISGSNAVPIPAAIWLFFSGIIGISFFQKRKTS